jgi:hypothetical protein
MDQITIYQDHETSEKFYIWLKDAVRDIPRIYPAKAGVYAVDIPRNVESDGMVIQATNVLQDRTEYIVERVNIEKDRYINVSRVNIGSSLVPDPFDVMKFNCIGAGDRLQLKIEFDSESPLMDYIYLV